MRAAMLTDRVDVDVVGDVVVDIDDDGDLDVNPESETRAEPRVDAVLRARRTQATTDPRSRRRRRQSPRRRPRPGQRQRDGSLARLLFIAICGCTAASPDPGYGALLQVPAAQFRPGPFPGATCGPVSTSGTTSHPSIVIGRLHETVHGVFDGPARAAILGVSGTDGTWIVAAGPPDTDTPGSATLKTLFGVSRDTAPGPI